jgi:hypothetical protein
MTTTDTSSVYSAIRGESGKFKGTTCPASVIPQYSQLLGFVKVPRLVVQSSIY